MDMEPENRDTVADIPSPAKNGNERKWNDYSQKEDFTSSPNGDGHHEEPILLNQEPMMNGREISLSNSHDTLKKCTSPYVDSMPCHEHSQFIAPVNSCDTESVTLTSLQGCLNNQCLKQRPLSNYKLTSCDTRHTGVENEDSHRSAPCTPLYSSQSEISPRQTFSYSNLPQSSDNFSNVCSNELLKNSEIPQSQRQSGEMKTKPITPKRLDNGYIEVPDILQNQDMPDILQTEGENLDVSVRILSTFPSHLNVASIKKDAVTMEVQEIHQYSNLCVITEDENNKIHQEQILKQSSHCEVVCTHTDSTENNFHPEADEITFTAHCTDKSPLSSEEEIKVICNRKCSATKQTHHLFSDIEDNYQRFNNDKNSVVNNTPKMNFGSNIDNKFISDEKYNFPLRIEDFCEEDSSMKNYNFKDKHSETENCSNQLCDPDSVDQQSNLESSDTYGNSLHSGITSPTNKQISRDVYPERKSARRTQKINDDIELTDINTSSEILLASTVTSQGHSSASLRLKQSQDHENETNNMNDISALCSKTAAQMENPKNYELVNILSVESLEKRQLQEKLFDVFAAKNESDTLDSEMINSIRIPCTYNNWLIEPNKIIYEAKPESRQSYETDHSCASTAFSKSSASDKSRVGFSSRGSCNSTNSSSRESSQKVIVHCPSPEMESSSDPEKQANEDTAANLQSSILQCPAANVQAPKRRTPDNSLLDAITLDEQYSLQQVTQNLLTSDGLRYSLSSESVYSSSLVETVYENERCLCLKRFFEFILKLFVSRRY